MKKHWITLSIVAVVILGAVTAAFFLSRPQGNAVMKSLQMTPTITTEHGVALESAFLIQSGYSIREDDLRKIITVEPNISYQLQGTGKNWTLTPDAPLAKNSVYTFGIHNLSGELIQSFAFQTKSDLLISRIYPADGESYVSPDTGIEITFNTTGVDAKDYFEIKPETAGVFETNDYTVIFRPDAPLELDSIYRITVKAGLTAPNGMVLTEDAHFSFETTSEDGKWDYTRLHLSGNATETFLTGDPMVVEMYSGDNVLGQQYDITMHRYPDINGYIKQIKEREQYYQERYGQKTDYVADTTGLEQVVSYKGKLFSKGEYQSTYYAILPDNLEEGHYIVTISGKGTNGQEQFVQKMIQIRNLSVYTQSANGDTLVWLNDPLTGEALPDRILYLTNPKDQSNPLQFTTQGDGTARIVTGEMDHGYLSIMEGGKTTYFDVIALSEQQESRLQEQFYGAVYTDREIYQPDDTIRFWGVLKPRQLTNSLPQTVYASLSNHALDGKIYQQKITVNPDGTFEGELSIRGIRQSWYSLLITDGEKQTYIEKGLTIETYTKPPYVIDVSTSKPFYYANEPIEFQISAHYFDGAPVSGGKLQMFAYDLGWEGLEDQGLVTLDANGEATLSGTYVNHSTKEWMLSWTPTTIFYSLENADQQDVQVYTNGTVTILPSRVAAKIESNSPTELTVYTARLDDSKLDAKDGGFVPFWMQNSSFDQLRGVSVDVPVTVLLHKTEYLQVPIGTYYDPVNKKNFTRYKMEQRESIEKTIETQTVGGKVTITDIPHQNSTMVFYTVEVLFSGEILGDVSSRLFYINPHERFNGGRNAYSFERLEFGRTTTYGLGDNIPLGLYENDIKISNKGKVLYSVLQKNMLTHNIFTSDSQMVEMAAEFIPNVTISGAYFDGRHVYRMESMLITYNHDKNTLKLSVESDKGSYQPGEKATITVTITDAQGKPVAASACVGIVDEAVFALREQNVDFAGQIYQSVYYPNLTQSVSYTEYDLDSLAPNTGGGGGGGDDEGKLREDFVDTALFQSVKTDASGKATVTVTLPDNVTSWRITAVAVTQDLQAGDNFANRIATLPFYLQPLFTTQYLEGDDLAFGVTGVGTSVTMGDQVEFTIVILDASGREIDRKSGNGHIGERYAFNLGKYGAGHYNLVLSSKSGEYTDSVSYPFAVVKEGLTVSVIENMPLEHVAKLNSLRYPVMLTVYDARVQPYMVALQKLAEQDGERTELLVSAYRAKAIFNELMPEEERQTIPRDLRLDGIQGEYGGIKALPVAEPDAATTAKMLIAAPQLIDQYAAKQFLQNTLKDAAAPPNERLMAYVGLAALKEPVMLDVVRLTEDQTLSVSDQLYLAVGLAKLGDFTDAQKVYQRFANQIITEGELKYLEGDGTPEQRLQNSAAALMLTSVLSHPDANGFMRFFNELDTIRAKNEHVVYQLEVLTYLEHFTVPQGKETGKFRYTVDGKTQEVELGAQGLKPFAMSYEALQSANFKTISGNVSAAVRYETYASRRTVSADGKLQIEKVYTPVSETLKAPSRVRVDLIVTFAEDAPNGCYAITDYIPSGMRYMHSNNPDLRPNYDWAWSSIQNEGQHVYGYIYRNKPIEPPVVPIPVPLDGQVIDKVIPNTNPEPLDGKVIPNTAPNFGGDNTQPDNQNQYTFTYYVNATLAGEFITEGAYITPHIGGIAAQSARGKIRIF